MDRTRERTQERQETEGTRIPLGTFGGGCSCGCCGPTDTTETDTTTVDPEQEIAELKELREATERRLAELDAE